jgi:hypothetical protein
MPNLMMSWYHAAELAGACTVAAVVLRRWVAARWAGTAAAIARESAVIAVLYAVWQLAGELSVMGTADAAARADWIDRAERAVWLPAERAVQDLVIHHSWLVQAANLYYASMHFGMLFVFLLLLFLRHRDRYGPVRTTLAVSSLVCLAISFVPVAPPRLVGAAADTAVQYGQSVYQTGLSADQLSAMPSVHVLWAVVVGWYGWRVFHGPWRYLWPLHTLLTVFVVVCTGNHWWFDGVVSVVVLVACAWLRHLVAAWFARARRQPAAAPERELVVTRT